MKIQKNWVGYIVWGLFSIVLFSNVAFSAVKLVENKTSTFSPLVTIAMTFGIVVLGAIFIILSYQLFMKYLYDKIFVEQQETSGENSFIGMIIFAFLIFTAILIRSVVIVAIGSDYTGDDTYFRLSLGVLTHSAAGLTTNGSFIYSDILNFLFNLFGKKFQVALILQVVLQTGICIFTFLGVKSAFGKLPAWIVLLFLAFLPGNFMAINSMNPALFFLFFFALFFWILALSVKENYVKPSNQFVHCCSYVVLGILAAALCFYDISGFIAVLFAFIFLLHKNENDDEGTDSFEQKPLTRISLFLVSFVVGLFILLFFVSVNGHVGFRAITEYFQQFIPQNGFDLYLLTPSAFYWDCMAPLLFVTIWFFGYIRARFANGIPFAAAIIVLFVFSVFKLDQYTYDLFNNLLWAVLSGIGFKSLGDLSANSDERERAKSERKSRRELKEQRRSLEAGEKSIKLNNLDARKVDPVESKFEDDDSPRTYGIGRKENIPMPGQVPPVSTVVSEREPSKPEVVRETEPAPAPVVKTKVAQVPVPPKDMIPSQHNKATTTVTHMNTNQNQLNTTNAIHDNEQKTEENKTDTNPIVQNTVVKHSAPMRRGYRTPSKSTFSPEELERIRLHTNGEFAYHTKEDMMKTSSEAKQDVVLKNNFINVLPDTRALSAQDNDDKTSVAAVPETKEEPIISVEQTPVKEDVVENPAPTEMPSLPPLVKDKFVEEKPKLIKNPLPGPKPHVSRELSFDYIPKDSEMDYDIKDLSGKDYYDI